MEAHVTLSLLCQNFLFTGVQELLLLQRKQGFRTPRFKEPVFGRFLAAVCGNLSVPERHTRFAALFLLENVHR